MQGRTAGSKEREELSQVKDIQLQYLKMWFGKKAANRPISGKYSSY